MVCLVGILLCPAWQAIRLNRDCKTLGSRRAQEPPHLDPIAVLVVELGLAVSLKSKPTKTACELTSPRHSLNSLPPVVYPGCRQRAMQHWQVQGGQSNVQSRQDP